jgi:hypothetical protein
MRRDYANGKACFVAGVNPKKAGEDFEGIPIYASVKTQGFYGVQPYQSFMCHQPALLLRFGRPSMLISIWQFV